MVAGCVIVREAGGRYCNLAGHDGVPASGNLVAGNVAVANALVKAIAPVLPPELAR
jgi:myo-inositol-1(or 4)-monophosphatase